MSIVPEGFLSEAGVQMTDVVLYDYPKSSASYRVRIALNLAGIDYRTETINLLEKEHLEGDHLKRNPQGFVPVLEIDGFQLTQSLAIIEYLDETRDLQFLPKSPAERAKAQALAMIIAIDVHPVCNLSVATHATGGKEPQRTEWMQHFIKRGLGAFEAKLEEFGEHTFSISDAPSLPDLCLIPQLYNANRWGVDYSECHGITRIEKACTKLPAFIDAHPSQV